MRLLIPVVFWVGLAGIAWELVQARRCRQSVTRSEVLYLVLALPLIFVAAGAFDLMGFPYGVVLPTAALCMGIALNAWVMKRRIQRRTNGSALKAAPDRTPPTY